MNQLASTSIHVAVVHRIPLIAEGLVSALRRHPSFEVVEQDAPPPLPQGETVLMVADYDTALQLVRSVGPIRPRVLVVAASAGERDVRVALDAGVQGFVLMDCLPEELYAGLSNLARGSRFLGAAVASRMADSLAHEALTEREVDVLRLMLNGLSNKLIARELDIALGTVKAHARSVFGKLHAPTRLQAVRVAAQRGLVPSCEQQVRA